MKEFYVQIDTGSDVLWVTCSPCTGCPTTSGLNVLNLSTLPSIYQKVLTIYLIVVNGGEFWYSLNWNSSIQKAHLHRQLYHARIKDVAMVFKPRILCVLHQIRTQNVCTSFSMVMEVALLAIMSRIQCILILSLAME